MNKVRHIARQLKWSTHYYGLWYTIVFCGARLLKFAGKDTLKTQWFEEFTAARFDARFGVDTKGKIQPQDLDIADERKIQAVEYNATASINFGIVLSDLNINYQDYAFVDFGSGKGRALLMASDFPFKQILGVELSTQLNEIAQANIAHYRSRKQKCTALRVMCKDATQLQLPNDPCVLYFINPFEEQVLSDVLSNIRASLELHPRRLIVIYNNAEMEMKKVFDECDFLANTRTQDDERAWPIYDSNLHDRHSS